MLTIITDFNNNEQMFKHYWMPLIIKHPECEFIFTKWNCNFNINRPNAKTYTCNREDAVIHSKNEWILLSEMNAVPTYATMIYLTSLKNENICCNPVWHDYMPSDKAGLPSNSFTIKKSLYNTSLTMKKYIFATGAKIINDLHVYFIRDT